MGTKTVTMEWLTDGAKAAVTFPLHLDWEI